MSDRIGIGIIAALYTLAAAVLLVGDEPVMASFAFFISAGMWFLIAIDR